MPSEDLVRQRIRYLIETGEPHPDAEIRRTIRRIWVILLVLIAMQLLEVATLARHLL